MLAVRIILFILTIVTFAGFRACYGDFRILTIRDVIRLKRYPGLYWKNNHYFENKRRCHLMGRIMLYVSIILWVTFCVLLIYTNCNWYIIPKILFLTSICLYIYKPHDSQCSMPFPLLLCIGGTIITFLIAVLLTNLNLTGTDLIYIIKEICNDI